MQETILIFISIRVSRILNLVLLFTTNLCKYLTVVSNYLWQLAGKQKKPYKQVGPHPSRDSDAVGLLTFMHVRTFILWVQSAVWVGVVRAKIIMFISGSTCLTCLTVF